MNGYRKMIRDNVPNTWDYALKWCQCKDRWIEYVYSSFIKPYNSNVMQSKPQNKQSAVNTVKQLLNMKKNKNSNLNFRDTIKWDDLLINHKETDDYRFWKNVSMWVDWFSKNNLFIMNAIDVRINNIDEDKLEEYINYRFNLNNIRLSKYLIKLYKDAH